MSLSRPKVAGTLGEAVERLSAGSRHVSRAYTLVAWIMLAAVFLWEPFVAPAVGFMFGGFLLRREGL